MQASGGAAVISGEALTQGFLASRGYFSPELWDVYWATRQVCAQLNPCMLHPQTRLQTMETAAVVTP